MVGCPRPPVISGALVLPCRGRYAVAYPAMGGAVGSEPVDPEPAVCVILTLGKTKEAKETTMESGEMTTTEAIEKLYEQVLDSPELAWLQDWATAETTRRVGPAEVEPNGDLVLEWFVERGRVLREVLQGVAEKQ